MKTLSISPVKSRVMAFLMTLVVVLGMAGHMVMPAMASGPSASSGIFDVVDGSGGITSSGGGFSTTDNTATSIANIISKYKTVAVALTGVLTITMLIFMLLQFTKLGAAGDNEMARRKAIMGILTTGIATALLGGSTVVIGFFWNAIK